jgi:hypothetical protein
MPARSAQQFLLAASAALRQSETQALQGTGVQATPISITASFDFELIQQKAIAAIPLDPGVEQRAQNSLNEFLKGFNSPNIDAINVEWYPRSISSGDVDHFVTLLRVLKQSFPDKQLTLTTGFSSAFNTQDQALQFYAAGVSSLGGFRASEGVDSKFLGIVFQQAFKGINADTPAPAGATDPGQWKWTDRAQQLSAMWSRGKASPDMAWWVNKVQDNMGLLALQADASGATSVTPLPALQTFVEISSTLAQSTQQVQVPAGIPGATDPAAGNPASTDTGTMPPAASGYVAGAQPSGQVAGSPFQQMLLTLVQQFTEQMAAKLMEKIGGSHQDGRGSNSAFSGASPSAGGTFPTATPSSGRSSFANTVWIGPSDINLSATSAAVGQSVVVTAQVHNQSSDQDISGLTVELVNPANPAAANQSVQQGVTVPRSGVAPVQLSWTPDATSVGQVQLLLQALDSGGQTITSVAIPAITIQNANGPSNGGSGANPSSSNNSGNSTTPGGSTTGPASAPQLTVNGFGLADASASAAGQIPPLQAQVSNPSQLPTQTGQAQLFMDTTPQQMQTIGAVLPSGALTLQFPAIQAAAGPHNLQLVVTTADGANASATFTVTVAAAGTASAGNSTAQNAQPFNGGAGSLRPRTVRAVVTTNFRIGNVQATSSRPRGVLVAANPLGKTATSGLSGKRTGAASTPASAPRAARTMLPAATTTLPAPATPAARTAMKTITPGTTSPVSSAPAVPAATTTLPAPATPASRTAVRTITPGTTSPVSSAPAVPAPTPTKPSSTYVPSATRTIAAPAWSPSAPAPSHSPAQPAARPYAGFNSAAPGVLDLAIAAQDVHLLPTPPRAGQTAIFTAAIKNLGTLPAQGASVVFILLANGRPVASSQPIAFNLPARSVFQARWSTLIPAVAGQQIMVSVTANGDSNPANNRAVVPFSVASAPVKGQLKPIR